jgi:hypothetical protein
VNSTNSTPLEDEYNQLRQQFFKAHPKGVLSVDMQRSREIRISVYLDRDTQADDLPKAVGWSKNPNLGKAQKEATIIALKEMGFAAEPWK